MVSAGIAEMSGTGFGDRLNRIPVVLDFSFKKTSVSWRSMAVGMELEADAGRRQFCDLLRSHQLEDTLSQQLRVIHTQAGGQFGGAFILLCCRKLFTIRESNNRAGRKLARLLPTER